MHDEFFKYNLKKKQILNGTLKSALPENILNMIDLEKTESEKTDFITDDLKTTSERRSVKNHHWI